MKNLVYLIIGLILGYLANMFLNPVDEPKVQEQMEIIKPKGVITPTEAKVLDQNFNARHTLISDSIVGKPDNRSSWYSLADMRDYLNYAENQAKELGYQMDGVRIYLGSHGERDYTTMFLVPTGLKDGGMLPQKSSDIIDGDALNGGAGGVPPNANYPQ